MKKPHLIVSSAYLDLPGRDIEYIESFETIKKITDKVQSTTLIETVSKDKINYLEDSGLNVYYSELNNPNLLSKGANWVFHMSNFLTKSEINNDDIVISVTGRYEIINDNIFNLIEKYIYEDGYEFIAKDDRDIYQPGGGVHTFYIAFKKQKFLEFSEWYKNKDELHVCVEMDLKSFMETHDKCLVLDSNFILGIKTNVFGLGIRQIS